MFDNRLYNEADGGNSLSFQKIASISKPSAIVSCDVALFIGKQAIIIRQKLNYFCFQSRNSAVLFKYYFYSKAVDNNNW